MAEAHSYQMAIDLLCCHLGISERSSYSTRIGSQRADAAAADRRYSTLFNGFERREIASRTLNFHTV